MKLSKDQLSAHQLNEAARESDRTKYEAWLLKTVAAAQTPGKDGSFAYQQLSQHFFMVYKPVATVLLSRFLSVKKGDRLSELFDKFSTEQKADLISQLRIPKPPG